MKKSVFSPILGLVVVTVVVAVASAGPQRSSTVTRAEVAAYGQRFGLQLRRNIIETALHGHGVVIADFIVGPDGRVTSDNVRSNDPNLRAMIYRVLYRVEAPPPPGGCQHVKSKKITADKWLSA